jgi:hypothetical protein
MGTGQPRPAGTVRAAGSAPTPSGAEPCSSALFGLMLTTGLRIEEALRWSDVDLTTGEVRVSAPWPARSSEAHRW